MRVKVSRAACRAWPLFGLVVFVFPILGHADDTHYQDYIIGGRAIGLGGAYVSLSDDPSGLYYNPAGLADVNRSSLQLSTSLYGFEQGTIKARPTLPVPGAEKLSISFADLIVVPASAGFVQSFGAKGNDGLPRQSYGFSVFVPSYRGFAAADGDQAHSYQRRVTDRELWSGTGYGRKFGQHLRLGISGFYVLRTLTDREEYSAQVALSDGNSKFQTVTNDIGIVSGNLVLIAGAKYILDDHWAFGASVQVPSVQIHAFNNLHFSRGDADPSAEGGAHANFQRLNITDARSQMRFGTTVRIGANYQKKYRYTLSMDMSVHGPVSYNIIHVADEYRNRLPFDPHIERKTVVNFNLGGEYLIVREVSVAGGFFTDFSSAPAIAAHPKGDQPPNVNLLGLALSLGYFGEHTLSRLGVVYSFGQGHDVIPEGGTDIQRLLAKNPTFSRVEYFQSFFYVFLSSSFRY